MQPNDKTEKDTNDFASEPIRLIEVYYRSLLEREGSMDRMLNPPDIEFKEVNVCEVSKLLASFTADERFWMLDDLSYGYREAESRLNGIHNLGRYMLIRPDVFMRVKQIFALSLAADMLIAPAEAGQILIDFSSLKATFHSFWEKVDVKHLSESMVEKIFDVYPFDCRLIFILATIYKSGSLRHDCSSPEDIANALTTDAFYWYTMGIASDVSAKLIELVDRNPRDGALTVCVANQLSLLSTFGEFQDCYFLCLHDLHHMNWENIATAVPYNRAKNLRAYRKCAHRAELNLKSTLDAIAAIPASELERYIDGEERK